jgi:hypothetical protein
MDCRHDLSSRAPTLQVQSPEFKPKSHLKRRKSIHPQPCVPGHLHRKDLALQASLVHWLDPLPTVTLDVGIFIIPVNNEETRTLRC